MTTARTAGGWSCTTAPATAPWRKGCARNTSAPSWTSCGRPLPPRLGAAHARGFADYFSTARHAATSAAARRKRRLEREVGPLGQYVGGTRAPLRPKLTP